MIGIIDYNVGNLQNLQNSFHYLNIPTKIIQTPQELDSCSKIVLPGVGAFGHAATQLKHSGFSRFWELVGAAQVHNELRLLRGCLKVQ